MSEKTFFRLILTLAILFSVGGVWLSSFILEDPRDGGRGGALAVALALVSLFTTRNYAMDVYESLTATLPNIRTRIIQLTKTESKTLPHATSDQKLDAFKIRLRLEAEGQKNQNVCLAISTGIGTIFWGFGDIFASWLM